MVNMRGVNLFFDYRKVKGKKVLQLPKTGELIFQVILWWVVAKRG